jgi:hypothetical protein
MSATRRSSRIAHRKLGASQQRPRRNQDGDFKHKRRSPSMAGTYAQAPETHGMTTSLRRSCRIARNQEAVRRNQAGAIPRKKMSTPGTRSSVDTEASSLYPAHRVSKTLELVVNILIYLLAVEIIGTRRVSKTFNAASDHPRCRIITFMRSVDDTLVLPSIAKNTCATLCPLLEPTAESGCRFISTTRSDQFSSPGSWERMYLTNPPATDALVRLVFRNTLYWGATIHATLTISDPTGLKLGSVLSKKSQGIFFLAQSLDNHGNVNTYAPKTDKSFQRSCDFKDVMEDFFKKREKDFGGSFRLHLSNDERYFNPKIGLTDGTVVWDGRKGGPLHHVTRPCGLQCQRRQPAIRPKTPAEAACRQPRAALGRTRQTTLVPAHEHCGCLAVRFGHA